MLRPDFAGIFFQQNAKVGRPAGARFKLEGQLSDSCDGSWARVPSYQAR
jgi:hypothetical protein